MVRWLHRSAIVLVVLAGYSAALCGQTDRPGQGSLGLPASMYGSAIEPILRAKCLACHNSTSKAGGLILESYQSLIKGGKDGPVIIPGNGAGSRLALQLEGKIKPQMPFSQKPLSVNEIATIKNWIDAGAPGPSSSVLPLPAHPTASELGIEFVPRSQTSVIVQRGGRRYLVNLATQMISPLPSPKAVSEAMVKSGPAPKIPVTVAAAAPHPTENRKVYEPGDDLLISLPTGRRIERHGWYVNFTHRFAYEPAFTGVARGHILGGLDGFSVSSFGFSYGVTSRLSVSAYRSPSIIGRPIQLMAAYNLLDERDHHPLNAAVRLSIEGQNDFGKNFTENIEGIFSRSLSHRAQLYLVPTASFQARRLVSSQTTLEAPPPTLPGTNTFSLGVGGALDIRPTVALVAEVIPTLVNGRPLGIHRPAYGFGIQWKIWRHAFTLGLTNSPGTTVSQRAGTRATFVNQPSDDTPSGLFLAFDLSRQLK